VTSVRDDRPNPMRHLVIVAFVVLALLSVPALAQEPRRVGGTWRLGGGVGYRFGEPVSPRVSIERWFTHRFAVGPGVEHVAFQQATLYPPRGASVQVLQNHALSVGLTTRVVLTSDRAPVQLSFVAIAEGGFSNRRDLTPFGFGRATERISFSVAPGLAVERRLLARWSIRLQASPMSLSFARTSQGFISVRPITIEPSEDFRPVTTVTFSLGLTAALELRFEL
jgi:hypothetical protein